MVHGSRFGAGEIQVFRASARAVRGEVLRRERFGVLQPRRPELPIVGISGIPNHAP